MNKKGETLENAVFSRVSVAPPVGLEPTTLRLTVVVTRISNSVIRFHAV